MQHKTANSVRLGHSPRPHPCVGYITNDTISSGSDTNGNPTGKYASSASKLTSTHTPRHTHYCLLPLLPTGHSAVRAEAAAAAAALRIAANSTATDAAKATGRS